MRQPDLFLVILGMFITLNASAQDAVTPAKTSAVASAPVAFAPATAASMPATSKPAVSAPVATESATSRPVARKPAATRHPASARTPGTGAAGTNAASRPNKAELVGPKHKIQLVQRLLQLMHPEGVGLTMLRSPVEEALRQSYAVLQGRVSSEKQAEALKDINGYAKEFMDKQTPLVIERGKRLATTTMGPILMDELSEDELTQLIAMYEMPVKAKLEALLPKVQRALGEKLAAEQGPIIKPRLEELQQRIGLRLRAASKP